MKETKKTYNQFNLIIETLSPLHIGNGEMLTSVGEFITTSDTIQYLELDKLNSFLDKSNLIDEYSEKILLASGNFDTHKTLSEDYKVNIKDFIQKTVSLKNKNLNPLNNNMLHIFCHENGKTYIPGSSLKGMLKTVLLFHKLKQDKKYLKTIEDTIKNKFGEWSKKKATNWLSEQWENKVKQETIFNAKDFNYLRLSDSSYFDTSDLQVEQVIRQHLYGSDSENLDWLEETIKKDTEIQVTLKIIPKFGESYSELNNPDSSRLFNIINEYSLHMIDFEINLISQSNYKNKKALIDFLTELKRQIESSNGEFAVCRLGKGKSIYFQTILSLLSKESLDILINKLKNIKDGEPVDFPKTRVLTSFDEMLGWIKIYEQLPDIVNNNVSELKEKTTIIQANYISQKTVSFKISSKLFENVQLINPFNRAFKKGEVINVIVWQVSSKGIHQVKIE